jgi:hypothetical protein
MWSVGSDNNDTDSSCAELGDEHKLNLVLMAEVEDGPSPIDIERIITSKNISHSKTIKLLRK